MLPRALALELSAALTLTLEGENACDLAISRSATQLRDGNVAKIKETKESEEAYGGGAAINS